MRMIGQLGRGPRGLYFGLGLAVGLGLAAHGVAASTVSTPCPSPGAAKALPPRRLAGWGPGALGLRPGALRPVGRKGPS
jgi:hypothetical protein